MPVEIKNHAKVIDAIRHSGILSELVEEHENHFKYELDLELMVYGRTYAEKRVGPYARLFVYEPGEKIICEGDWGRNTFFILLDGQLDVYVHENGTTSKVNKIELQNIFGEMSVLAGQPSTATIAVPMGMQATVLEIERPALRLLRKFKKFGDRFEHIYRQHGLDRTLREVQVATQNSFSSELLDQLKQAARFIVYPKGHLLFREGDSIDHLIFINDGWVRRMRGLADGIHHARGAARTFPDMVIEVDEDVGLDFVGAGNWLGLEAVADNNQTQWRYSATIMGRTEAFEIAIANLRFNPVLSKLILQEFPHFSDADDNPPEAPPDARVVTALSKEISTGIVDGTNLLVMDMDRCVRCGNCSMACHKVHGQSRLLRHGIHISRPLKPMGRSIQHVLLPSVCLHCHDPECLTGCPTGAIARLGEGQIDIHRDKCIGCGDCATQCPYDAISLIPRKSSEPVPQNSDGRLPSWLTLRLPPEPPPVTATTDLVAVKCNLCQNTKLNPEGAKKAAYSCEENCPTGALVRVNPREYFSEAKNSIGIVFKDQTHAIGRNIHKRDMPARVIHATGIAAIIAITSAVLLAVRRHNLDGHLEGTWLTMRWITGMLGLGSIAGAVTYMARKQIYNRRVGPLRYWKVAHAYLGLLAGIVFLIHGGRSSGGLLTSMLMVSFDVTIVSGLFGITCYFIVPRIMTSIEGDPLLIEDLRTRRQELCETLALIDTSDEQLRSLVKEKIRKRFFSFSYLLRQYLRREELTTMLSDARGEFRSDAESLDNQSARRSLMQAVETTATLRRVDSLIYLHQLLKLWLAPHVVSVSIMVALLCVHIVQVVLFTVR